MKKKAKRPSNGRAASTIARQGNRLHNLVQVYHDLENTLRTLCVTPPSVTLVDRGLQINVSKLISQLSQSKQHIERKIKKGLAQEKTHLRRRLKTFVDIRKEFFGMTRT